MKSTMFQRSVTYSTRPSFQSDLISCHIKLIMYNMTKHSARPGSDPRSFRFHSLSISCIQSGPNHSIAKYSTRCEAAPSNTAKNIDRIIYKSYVEECQ